MQDFTIMCVVGSFAAANKNSAVLMLSSNSACSPRWDITPNCETRYAKKSLCLRKTSVRKTPLRKFDYRNKCFHIRIVWRPGFSEVVESYHVIGLNSLDTLGDYRSQLFGVPFWKKCTILRLNIYLIFQLSSIKTSAVKREGRGYQKWVKIVDR